MTTSIWWIRRDLRLTDNQALSAAVDSTEQVIPLFILDPQLLNSEYNSPRRTIFLLRGLQRLDAQLRARGSMLFIRAGKPVVELKKLQQETSAIAIYAEQDFSPFAIRRDDRISKSLPLTLTAGVTIRSVGSVLKQDGTYYTVFTPYSKAWKRPGPIERQQILPAPKEIRTRLDLDPQTSALEAYLDELTNKDDTAEPTEIPGEEAAKGLLADFIKSKSTPIHDYANSRDFPSVEGTSRLSPYLRFGMVSSRLAALGAYEAIHKTGSPIGTSKGTKSGAEVWLDELIWRDFYITILAAFPSVRSGSFRPEYDNIRWANSELDFSAWCQGRTGYPFIDAAMRQLLNTGWMHNRARMAVASFLVKDLLIDWRWGEKWFMQQLLDGDPAANNGGWQWSAGTGTDAAPYFRIFNPISQGKKFDKAGEYVRTWVPELARVPDKYIHEPWLMPKSEQVKARCVVSPETGADYPSPIIDHKWARERTLAAYKAAKDGK